MDEGRFDPFNRGPGTPSSADQSQDSTNSSSAPDQDANSSNLVTNDQPLIGPSASSVVRTPHEANWTGSMNAPEVPNRQLRQIVWREVFNNKPFSPPSCGPFEIMLPAWLDFYRLVYGDNGSLITCINNEIISPSLMISWLSENNGARALVVGFRTDMNIQYTHPGVQHSLRELWSQVVGWAENYAYKGKTRALATHLGLIQVEQLNKSLSDRLRLPMEGGSFEQAYQATQQGRQAKRQNLSENDTASIKRQRVEE
ncbi:hypothetical protein FSARC_3435 [Fusarium sarcochroum]|uniref:Uncharacterized protein n=1 Tax=Fusarium sarcochroum TaxID=1208366 RepID=A0A8H4U4E1_9HYPO|nr:hypothetical protein FSARC_3435 [Fusarium sarcochroum]